MACCCFKHSNVNYSKARHITESLTVMLLLCMGRRCWQQQLQRPQDDLLTDEQALEVLQLLLLLHCCCCLMPSLLEGRSHLSWPYSALTA
jgi:hypothetical protein